MNSSNLASFAIRRTVTAAIVLAMVVIIIVALLNYNTCARIDAIKAEILQQINQEIIEKKIISQLLKRETRILKRECRKSL